MTRVLEVKFIDKLVFQYRWTKKRNPKTIFTMGLRYLCTSVVSVPKSLHFVSRDYMPYFLLSTANSATYIAVNTLESAFFQCSTTVQ